MIPSHWEGGWKTHAEAKAFIETEVGQPERVMIVCGADWLYYVTMRPVEAFVLVRRPGGEIRWEGPLDLAGEFGAEATARRQNEHCGASGYEARVLTLADAFNAAHEPTED